MKLTKHAQERLEERSIKAEWVYETIKSPDDIQIISKNEIRYWKKIGNKILRVVANPERERIITAFFDRNKNL